MAVAIFLIQKRAKRKLRIRKTKQINTVLLITNKAVHKQIKDLIWCRSANCSLAKNGFERSSLGICK